MTSKELFHRHVPTKKWKFASNCRYCRCVMLLLVKLVLSERHLDSLAHVVDWICLYLLELHHRSPVSLSRVIQQSDSIVLLDYLLETKHWENYAFEDALMKCVDHDHLPAMKKLFQDERLIACPEVSSWLFGYAVSEDRRKIMQWLWEHQRQICVVHDVDAVKDVAIRGDVDIIRFLFDEDLVANRAELAICAASSGNVAIFQYLREKKLIERLDEVASNAAANGNLEIVRFLVDNEMIQDSQTIATRAASRGHRDILQFLWDRKLIKCVRCVVEHAIVTGQCECVEWFEQLSGWHPGAIPRGCGMMHELTVESMQEASFLDKECFMARVIRNGRLRALRWLLMRFPEIGVDGRVVIWTAYIDDASLFEWVLIQAINRSDWKHWMYGIAIAKAIWSTNERMLQLLMDGSLGSVGEAFEKGEPELVAYLQGDDLKAFYTGTIDRIISWSRWSCSETMEAVVKTLCETCSGYDVGKLIETAARHSFGLPLLRYFDVKNESITVQLNALKAAMWNGHLESVKHLLEGRLQEELRPMPYLLERDHHFREYFGVPEVALYFVSMNLCIKQVVECAARRKIFDVIRHVHELGAQGFTYRVMDEAAAVGSLRIVRFLHEQRQEGCSVSAMDYAARNGYLHVVKYLHEHRSEGCTTDAMDYAASNGHLRVVEFLDQNRREGCTTKAFTSAAERGHLRVVKYLWDHQREKADVQRAMELASSSGCWSVVQWLVANADDPLDFASALEFAERTQEKETELFSAAGKQRVVAFLSERVAMQEGGEILSNRL